jgi:hypothetical protein
MEDIKEKIRNFTDWCSDNGQPHDWSVEEVNLIAEHECMCDFCHTSIFELDDSPTVILEEDRLLCEECHTDEDNGYYFTCAICENSNPVDIKSDNLFYVGVEDACCLSVKSGVYKMLTKHYYERLEVNCKKEYRLSAKKVKERLGYKEIPYYTGWVCANCKTNLNL